MTQLQIRIPRRAALMAGVGGVVAAAVGAPAHAALESGPMPLDEHGYRPAARVGDSIPWQIFGSTQSVERQINGFTWIVPRFSPQVRQLDGKVIRVNGYMMPLEETPTQRRFLLMAYPQSCPYCLSVGSQFFIEVLATRGVKFSYDAILIEGKLELVEQDENGIYYRLHNARQLNAR